MQSDGAPKELSSPKHGDEDDKEHIGGNRWAGGTGGADTAGLGGRGGPYRVLDSINILMISQYIQCKYSILSMNYILCTYTCTYTEIL